MKLFLINIFLFVGILTANAQNFGVQVGTRINLSDIESLGVDVNRKIGFEGGVFYQYSINDESLSIRAALLYFRQEFSLGSNLGNNTGITYHFKEDNLKLPLTVEWRPLRGLFRPVVNGGLYLSQSIHGRISDKESGSKLQYGSSGDKYDYGALIGVGFSLSSNIALTANYEYGFADRYMALGDQSVSVKNRGCSVAIQYLF